MASGRKAELLEVEMMGGFCFEKWVDFRKSVERRLGKSE